MRPIRFTFGNLAAASANNIAASQSLASATTATINGSAATAGIATLDQARRVIITSAGNDSGITFTVFGTNRSNTPISEVVTGGNIAAAQTNNDFLTITKISSSGATAAAITVGTNGVASYLVPVDWMNSPTNVSVNATVAGTINYTVNTTLDDPYNSLNPTTVNGTALIAAGAVTAQANTVKDLTALQFVINSGAGSIAIQVVQSGGTSGA